MSVNGVDVTKVSRLWSKYRSAVDFLRDERKVEAHQALFNVFCKEFTFRVEMAFKEKLEEMQTGYDPFPMEDWVKSLRQTIIQSFEVNAYEVPGLFDSLLIRVDKTSDGRWMLFMWYKPFSGELVLSYSITFPFFTEVEREWVYSFFE